jgi:hypothetical protein
VAHIQQRGRDESSPHHSAPRAGCSSGRDEQRGR